MPTLKFLVVAMICIIIPLLISGFYSVTSLSNSLESEAKNSLNSATSEKKSYIDLAFKDQMDLATSIANEISTANNEMATGTGNIANKTANDVSNILSGTKEISEQLKFLITK